MKELYSPSSTISHEFVIKWERKAKEAFQFCSWKGRKTLNIYLFVQTRDTSIWLATWNFHNILFFFESVLHLLQYCNLMLHSVLCLGSRCERRKRKMLFKKRYIMLNYIAIFTISLQMHNSFIFSSLPICSEANSKRIWNGSAEMEQHCLRFSGWRE